MFQIILLAVVLCANLLEAETAALIKVPKYSDRQVSQDIHYTWMT